MWKKLVYEKVNNTETKFMSYTGKGKMLILARKTREMKELSAKSAKGPLDPRPELRPEQDGVFRYFVLYTTTTMDRNGLPHTSPWPPSSLTSSTTTFLHCNPHRSLISFTYLPSILLSVSTPYPLFPNKLSSFYRLSSSFLCEYFAY